jgi:hypothetical protein
MALMLTKSQQQVIAPKSAMSEDTRRVMFDVLEEAKKD